MSNAFTRSHAKLNRSAFTSLLLAIESLADRPRRILAAFRNAVLIRPVKHVAPIPRERANRRQHVGHVFRDHVSDGIRRTAGDVATLRTRRDFFSRRNDPFGSRHLIHPHHPPPPPPI